MLARVSSVAVDGTASGRQGFGRQVRLGIGTVIVDGARHLHACHAVDRGVVDLADDREAALRHALDPVQALHDVELPERAVQVEGPRHQPGRLDAELAPVARVGQGDVADVELQIEARVFDPVGVVEVERHPHEAPPEGLGLVEPRLDVLQDPLERHLAARRRRRVVDRQPGPGHVGVGYLGVQERRVHPAQLLHGDPPQASRRAANQRTWRSLPRFAPLLHGAATFRLVSTKAPTRGPERALWDAGHEVVVGIDEVGRGAWAGPLMVGAAVLPRDKRVNKVRDSKLLTEPEREQLFDRVARLVRGLGGGRGHPGGVRRAGHGRGPAPRRPPSRRRPRDARRCRRRRRHLGLRGRRRPAHRAPGQGRRPLPVGGGRLASWPRSPATGTCGPRPSSYPHWSFDTNKGYPCPVHKAALQGYGPSAIHRRTWVFMDHYVPWPGMRVYRPAQPTLF